MSTPVAKTPPAVILFLVAIVAAAGYFNYVNYIAPLRGASAGAGVVLISFKGCFVASALNVFVLLLGATVVSPGLWRDENEKKRETLLGVMGVLFFVLWIGSYYGMRAILSTKGYG